MSAPTQYTADDAGRMVMLVYGTMADGNPFWCYVAVKPSKYEQFNQINAAKKLDLRTFEQGGFGEIIVSGEGVIPPRDVTKHVAAMFNVPIRQLFAKVDPVKVINDELEKLNKNPPTS